jgi:glycerol-3-phosphate dehydrogenase (NAD(P)+)
MPISTKTTSVAVVGGGSWGTAVANLFADAGCKTTLWARDTDLVFQINTSHRNEKYLKGIALSPKLMASGDLKETIENAEIVVNSIPTQHIRSVFQPVASLLAGKIVVNTSKGIEQNTHARVSEIFKSLSPKAKYVILSGPSFALEVVKRLPTAVTVASEDESATLIQKLLSLPYFRAYTSKDVVGVELAGALKNVVAISSGIVAGIGLGHNAQAALINRGMAEILRFGLKLGAQELTFLGLAGMGDLILTCTGPLSRNLRLGLFLGQGKSLKEAIQQLGGVAEGYYTAKSALELSKLKKVEMPITQEVYNLLYMGSTPQQALHALMSRDLKEEW